MQHPIATKYVNWKYLGRFPVSELPYVAIGRHDDTPIQLRCGLVTDGLKASPRVVSKVRGKKPNPRHSGRMEWVRRDPVATNERKLAQEAKMVVLKETAFCNKSAKCTALENSKNKRQLCAFAFRWVICLDDLHSVLVWVQGDHGPQWRVDPKAMKIAPFLRAKVLESDGLDSGPGGRTTPMQELLRIQARLGDLDDTTRDIVPTLRQLQALIGYERSKRANGGGSIVENLERTLAEEGVGSHVLYPTSQDRSISEEVKNKSPFWLMLRSKEARPLVRKYGRIIGLDGLFKLTKLRWPVWAVVVEDEKGHAWPIAFIFASLERQELLLHALRVLHQFIVEDGHPWAPWVMIDKDEVERGAVAAMGWTYLLCDFHVQKTWRAVLQQAARRSTPLT